MENDCRHIPNRLEMHRKQMRYKQKDVAKILGVPATQVSKWENGTQMPNGVNLIRLSIIYRALPTELYFEFFQDQREKLNFQIWDVFGKTS